MSITINLSHIPDGISHQEYEWKYSLTNVLEDNDSINVKGIFKVNSMHQIQYEFNGNILFTLNLICDRCNDKFKKSFNEKVHFIVKKNTNIEDINIINTNNDIADITEYIRDMIVVSIPIKKLCKDNCKGLCPVCGINLNRETCECDK